MTEKLLNMKNEENNNTKKQVNQKSIKDNIKKQISNRNISIRELSKKTHLSVCRLILLLYCPFLKIKLSHSIKICKALKIKVSDILK